MDDFRVKCRLNMKKVVVQIGHVAGFVLGVFASDLTCLNSCVGFQS